MVISGSVFFIKDDINLIPPKLIFESLLLIRAKSPIFGHTVIDAFLDKQLPPKLVDQAAGMRWQNVVSVQQFDWTEKTPKPLGLVSPTNLLGHKFFKSAEFLSSSKSLREIHRLCIGRAPIIMMSSLERSGSEVSLTRPCPAGSFYFAQP